MSELRSIARGVPGPMWRRINMIRPSIGTAGITVEVPGKCAWEIMSVSAVFVASADAGNRVPILTLVDNDNAPLWTVEATAPIIASGSRLVSWTAGLGAVVVGSTVATALPLPSPAYALPGERLMLAGMTDDTDAINGVRLVVIETYTGDEIHEANAEQQIVDHWHALYELYRDRRV